MIDTSISTSRSSSAKSTAKSTAMAIIAVLAWFALLLQLFLMIHSAASSRETLQAVVNFFSFFTILTNLLVAVGLTLALLAPNSAAGRFFARPAAESGTAVYIAVVGITYALLLRHLWNPQGAQKLADVLLHDVLPVLYVGFWATFVPKAALRWSDALRWLAYPIAYMVYTVLHGLLSGWYPYYFIDIGAIGLPHALRNAAAMLIAFFLLGLLAVAPGRWSARRSPAPSVVE